MPTRQPNARGEGEQLRQQLVAAASVLLLDTQSVDAPSLRSVARSCNVSPAAVYLHFASRDALIVAVIDAHLADLRAHMEQAIATASESPAAQLLAFADGYVGWGLAHPGAYQLLFESADRLNIPGHGDPVTSSGDERWYLLRRSEELLEAASGVLGSLGALRLWTALHGMVSLRLHKPDLKWPPAAKETRVIVSHSAHGG